MAEFFTTSDGRKLGFRREGDGPVLVCHPGGPGFSSRYLGDMAGLGALFALIMVDPRGTAESDRPADPCAYMLDDYVRDLEEVRAHLRLEKMLLLGHSHGGLVAMGYASKYPERVERLVLASTLARFADEQRLAMEAEMERRVGESWYADARAALAAEEAGLFASDQELSELVMRQLPLFFATYGQREVEYVDTLRAEVVNADALRLWDTEIQGTFDLRDSLARISAATLVMTGQDDFITGPLCAEEVASLVAGAKCVIIPQSGHMVFVEARDRFRLEVSDFLLGSGGGISAGP